MLKKLFITILFIFLITISACSQNLGEFDYSFNVDRHDLDQSSYSDMIVTLQQRIRDVSVEVLNYTVTVVSFYDEVPESVFRPRAAETTSLGSGILFARDEDTVYVLTNRHVIENAQRIEILLNDGREFIIDDSLTHGTLDLGLMKFDTKDEVPIANIGNSDQLEVGDFVLAVGAPLGFTGTVTFGIVSSFREEVFGDLNFIQTDASINSGNSGGPLVDLNGYVVGLNTWIASQNGGNIGLGFAIPINDVLETFEN